MVRAKAKEWLCVVLCCFGSGIARRNGSRGSGTSGRQRSRPVETHKQELVSIGWCMFRGEGGSMRTAYEVAVVVEGGGRESTRQAHARQECK